MSSPESIRTAYKKKVFRLILEVERKNGPIDTAKMNECWSGVVKWEEAKFRKNNFSLTPLYHDVINKKIQTLREKLGENRGNGLNPPMAMPNPYQERMAKEKRVKDKFYQIKDHMRGSTLERIKGLKNFFREKVKVSNTRPSAKFEDFLLYLNKCEAFLNSNDPPVRGFEEGLHRLHSMYKTIKETEARVSSWVKTKFRPSPTVAPQPQVASTPHRPVVAQPQINLTHHKPVVAQPQTLKRKLFREESTAKKIRLTEHQSFTAKPQGFPVKTKTGASPLLSFLSSTRIPKDEAEVRAIQDTFYKTLQSLTSV